MKYTFCFKHYTLMHTCGKRGITRFRPPGLLTFSFILTNDPSLNKLSVSLPRKKKRSRHTGFVFLLAPHYSALLRTYKLEEKPVGTFQVFQVFFYLSYCFE